MACSNPVYAIDVSNYQEAETSTPEALSALLDRIVAAGGNRPTHIVVRCGLSVEKPRLHQIAVAQMQAANALGLTVSLYVWIYAGADQNQAVMDAMNTSQEAGVPFCVLWADFEDSNPAPGWNDVIGFIASCQANGVTYYGIYTGAWWANAHMQGWDLAGVWLWDANYNNQENLRLPGYNGMMLVGHQYSDRAPDGSGLDMDIFAPEASGYSV